MIHQELYKKLKKVIPNLDKIEEHAKLKSEGFMDLNVDVHYKEGNTTYMALSHYYKHPSGDMIPDPDMEIAVYHDRKMAEALSYQDIYGYRQVYPVQGKVDLKAKKELNAFLNTWLNNLQIQGHKVEGIDEGKGRG